MYKVYLSHKWAKLVHGPDNFSVHHPVMVGQVLPSEITGLEDPSPKLPGDKTKFVVTQVEHYKDGIKIDGEFRLVRH